MTEYNLTGEQATQFNIKIWENGSKYWIGGHNIREKNSKEGSVQNIYEIENQRVIVEASVSFETNKRIDKAAITINLPDNLILKKTLEKLTGVTLN